MGNVYLSWNGNQDLAGKAHVVKAFALGGGKIFNSSRAFNNNSNKIINPTYPVYFSYAGNNNMDDTLEQPIEALRKILDEANIDYRDYKVAGKSNFTYRRPMIDSEDEIGNGHLIVVVFSIAYIKSSHCMYEWYNIVRNPDYTNRIFPIYMDDLRERLKSETRTALLHEILKQMYTEIAKKEVYNPNTLSEKDKFILSLGDDAFKNELDEIIKYFHDKSVPKLGKMDFNVLLEQIYSRIQELESPTKDSLRKSSVRISQEYSLPKLPCSILSKYKDNIFIPRDNDIQTVADKLATHKVVNITGIGGCGKSTISIMYLVGTKDVESKDVESKDEERKYYKTGFRDRYTHITDIIINTENVYKEFCERFTDIIGSHQPDCFDTFNTILKFLSQYPAEEERKNLFVMDVNETADYDVVKNVAKCFVNICAANWKLLIVSREPLCGEYDYIDISRVDTIEYKFIKTLFFRTLNKDIKSFYEGFSDENLTNIFSKLGNLPILIKALAEYLNAEKVLTVPEIMGLLGNDNLSVDLHELQCKGVNKENVKEDVYSKIGAFLGHLCIFKKLKEVLQKRIVSVMMLWDPEYYSKDFIQKMVLGKVKVNPSFTNALTGLLDKCWLDSRRNNNELEYKMHGLIAQTSRNQVFNYDDNIVYRDFSDYLRNIKRCTKLENNIERTALIKSLSKYDLTDDADFLVRQAHEFRSLEMYERALKIKVLKLQNPRITKSELYDKLASDTNIINCPVYEFYYSWLAQLPDKSLSLEKNALRNTTYVTIPIMGKGNMLLTTFRMVKIDDNYCLGECQVTQHLWTIVMGNKMNNPSIFNKGDNYPVENVSWYDCFAFIMELNYKTGLKFSLPTRAEWVYAASCRGIYKQYSGTDDESELGKYAWFKENSEHCTHEVKTREPNDIGIYDMTGNVREWSEDYYSTEKLLHGHISLGGSWSDAANKMGLYTGYAGKSESRFDNFGFRLALRLNTTDRCSI